ncbi:MAG: glycosyltransferase family 4 protein [Propionibacteriaceae bacterium]|nr:glycosyltransferase family 4 protein [Propionibacteriaceae bacterium]
MKFVFFSAQYLPTIGGVERFNHNLARTLINQGHQVTIVASQLPGVADRAVDQGLEILRVPSWPVMGGRYPLPKPTRAFRAMMAPVWQGEIDLALINTRFWPLSVYAARACRRRGVPAIMLEHGSDFIAFDNPVVNAISHLYERIVAKITHRAVPAFYAVSKLAGQWLKTFGIQATGTLYNAVDPVAIKRELAEGGEDIRAGYGLPKTSQIVVYLGRLLAEKGIYQLLEAMKTVRQACPEAVLLIAGEGPMGDELAALRQDGVLFLGGLSHPQALGLLSQATIFCLPTYYPEGFPTVVLEAAAVGTFIVTTPVGGTPELLGEDEDNGLVPLRDTPALAAMLIKALSDPSWRAAVIARTSAKLEAEFTWAKTAEHLVEIAQKG